MVALTNSQLKILRSIAILDLIFFIITFGMIVHNLYKYIYKLKLYRPLIMVFYLFIIPMVMAPQWCLEYYDMPEHDGE